MADPQIPARQCTRGDLQRLAEAGAPVDAAYLVRAIRLLDDAEREAEGLEDDLDDAKRELGDAEGELGRMKDRLYGDVTGALTVVGAGRADEMLAPARAMDVVVLTGNPIAIDRVHRLYGAAVTLQRVDETS